MIELHRRIDPYFSPILLITDNEDVFFSISSGLLERAKEIARLENRDYLDMLEEQHISDFPDNTEKVKEAFVLIRELLTH